MLSIEEYILKRKQIDNLNEKDIESKEINKKLFIAFVTEYFDSYIDVTSEENNTIANEIRAANYIKSLRDLSKESKDFLVKIYLEHRNYIDKYLRNIIQNENPELFLLSDDESYNNISEIVFPKMFKKYPYLKNCSKELYMLLKDIKNWFFEEEFEFISQEFNGWANKLKKQYDVDIARFGFNYASYWYDNHRLWEKQTRILEDKEYDMYNYEWKRAKDPFNISILYSRFKHLPYIKNHKKDLEMAVMYFWCTQICGSEDDLRTYIQKFIEN
jgi:hypothetical protein